MMSLLACVICFTIFVFFFKQKTAYEMRISDWSSDVCSSDLDGPSAGIGIVTSIVSTLTGVPVRREIAMTGEVTLRGRVLPIGVLKEKLLAALRAGIATVLIHEENEKALVELPPNMKEGPKIIPVVHIDEALATACPHPPQDLDRTP